MYNDGEKKKKKEEDMRVQKLGSPANSLFLMLWFLFRSYK